MTAAHGARREDARMRGRREQEAPAVLLSSSNDSDLVLAAKDPAGILDAALTPDRKPLPPPPRRYAVGGRTWIRTMDLVLIRDAL